MTLRSTGQLQWLCWAEQQCCKAVQDPRQDCEHVVIYCLTPSMIVQSSNLRLHALSLVKGPAWTYKIVPLLSLTNCSCQVAVASYQTPFMNESTACGMLCKI